MEGSESTISRVGRAVWTVWGYLTGTVGRYLRPEVTNQEAHNVHFKQDETVSISKGYKELQVKEEDKERTKTKTERKTIEDLQYPGVSVRAAAVQWEKSNIVCDGHEVKDKSKHTCISSKVIDKRAQKDKEKTLDNKNESQKTPNNQFTEQEDSPASIVADVKNQERTFSGGEEDDFNVGKSESKQDQTKKPEEKEKRVEFEEIGKEEYAPWLDQGLTLEVDLNFEKGENSKEQERRQERKEDIAKIARKEENDTDRGLFEDDVIVHGLLAKELYSSYSYFTESNENSQKEKGEEEAVEIMRRDDKTEEGTIKNDLVEQELLANEAKLNVKEISTNQEQGGKKEEKVETGEEMFECEFVEQGLLAKEADLNLESNVFQERGEKEGKEVKSADEIKRREKYETEEEQIKGEVIDKDLLANKSDLHFEISGIIMDQRIKTEEEGVDEMSRRENYETEEEPIKSEFIDKFSEADINVEGNKNSQKQERADKAEVESANEISRRENDETEDEPVKSEFIDQFVEADLNVEGNANNEQQGMTDKEEVEEVESADEISRRENYETEEEPIESEFFDQGLLTTDVDLNVERNENNQEQGWTDKEEEVKNVKSADKISRRENYETEEEPIKSEFFDQGLLTTDVDLNVERIENSQEQEEGKEEKGVKIIRHENDDTGKDVFKCEFVEQGLMTEEADPNLESNVYIQEQERKEEMEIVSADEIIRRDNDETEKEPVKSEFIGQGLLANTSDLNVELNVISVQQRTKSKDEGVEVSYDKTEEELSEFIDQFIESDLNVEGNVNKQEQRRTDKEEEIEEVESADEIMREERDENEEEPSEFTDQCLLAMEADLNVENNENPEQGGNEEEEGVEIIMRENDEIRESTIKCEFVEQGLLAKEDDLNVEKHENSQKQRRISQDKKEEEYVDDSLPEYEGTEDKPSKTKLIVQEPEEQASLCGMQDTAMVQVVLEESIIGYVNDQDNTELYVVEESNHVKTKHENQASNSQMVDEAHQASTWEGKAPLNEGLKLVENVTLFQEKKVIEVINGETKKETVGKENDGYKNEFSAFEKFTGIDTVEEQKVCDTEKKETLNKIEVIVEYVETESQQLERTQIETAEGCSSTRCEDEDNSSAVTVKLQKLEQSKEQKDASEVALKADRKHIDDAAYDHNGSQQTAALTKPEAEVVITQPEKMTGSQTETAETTSKFKEVAAIDVIKSTERETSLHEQPIDTEVAIQEIMRPCLLAQQGPLLEESADKRINELSLVKSVSEIQSVPFKQLSEFAVESVDEMQTYSMQNLDKCSKEAKLSSPKQTAEWFETLSETTVMRKDEQKFEQATDMLIQEDATLEDQINQNECTVQDSATDTSSHRLQLDFSDSLYMPEMQSDSQKDTEEQARTDEEENGLSDEIKHNTSGLTKESDDSKWKSMREMETTERKENESELESHDETFENMKVEILNVAWKCEKELTEMIDIETMVVSTHGEMESVKKMEQPFTEQEKDKCELVFPECKESKEMNKEHEKVEHGKSVVDCKEDVEQGGRPGLKRPFEKIAEDNDMDKPCVLTGLSLASQASSLDFTVQKWKIAVKNPLVRPPKDPRSLINMASVEPLIPPRPLQPSFPKKSHIEGASVPSKGVIGFKLPGLGAGFPALRKTEAGKKIRDGEEAGSETSHVQKSNPDSQSADDTIKQEIKPPKPKWTPPRQPGMGSPLMMAELKSKLKKPE